MRSLTPSFFRPSRSVDQSILKENRKLTESIERRAFLRGTLSLGALDYAHRLRRDQQGRDAKRAARHVGMERPRAGVPVLARLVSRPSIPLPR